MPVLVVHDELDEEVEAYPYQELGDDAKFNARVNDGWDERHRDDCVEWMVSDANALWATEDSWELQYSIGFCQGDGVGIKGSMDATDIRDPEWVQTILPMLGAHKRQATVGGHDVSWPWPIIEARLEFSGARSGGGYSPGFSDGDLEVTFVLNGRTSRGFTDDDEEIDHEIVVNHYVAADPDDDDRGAVEIWRAMCDYFRTACNKLYRQCTDAILDGDEDGFKEECAERNMLFDETGRIVQEEIP